MNNRKRLLCIFLSGMLSVSCLTAGAEENKGKRELGDIFSALSARNRELAAAESDTVPEESDTTPEKSDTVPEESDTAPEEGGSGETKKGSPFESLFSFEDAKNIDILNPVKKKPSPAEEDQGENGRASEESKGQSDGTDGGAGQTAAADSEGPKAGEAAGTESPEAGEAVGVEGPKTGEAVSGEEPKAGDAGNGETPSAGTDTSAVQDMTTVSGEAEYYFRKNSMDVFLREHTSLSASAAYYLNGRMLSYSTRYYAGKDILSYESSDGDILVVTPGDIYGFDGAAKTPYRDVFLDDQSREKESAFWYQLYDPSREAEILEISKKGSEVVITQRKTDRAGAGMIESAFFPYMGETDSWVEVHHFSMDTGLRTSTECYIEKEDGERSLAVDTVFSADAAEAFKPPKSLTERLNAPDGRSLHILLNPQTEEEAWISSEVGTGCYFNIFYTDEYTELYTDVSCRNAAEAFANKEGDVTLFGRKA